jgi:palmitoyltransferase ZDHHC9/14/18
MGEAPPPPLSSSPPPAPTTLHQRDETSESTSSIRTTWIQGGFTPKASQDPLIITQTSSSQPPIVNPLQPSNVNPSPSILPPPPTDTSVVTPTPTRTTKMQKIQISKPFTRIPSNRIFSSSSNPTPLKRYQLHQGRNRFLLGGLLMTSRDNVLPFLASLLLAIILPILWITFVGRGLWENDNNNDRGSGPGGMKGVVIVFVYLTLIFWSSMIKTSLSDPGILPRNLDPQPIRKYVEHDEDVNHSGGGKGEFVAEVKYLRVRDGVVGSKCTSSTSVDT